MASPQPTPTTILITGTTRGIGHGLLAAYLARPHHVIIAANRSVPTSEDDSPSQKLYRHPTTRLVHVKIDAASGLEDPARVAEELGGQGLIPDMVIANAGLALSWPTVRDLDMADMRASLEVNVGGLVGLFRGMRGLDMLHYPNASYGPTKLVGHYITKKMHMEEPWLTAFPIDPGWVQTDMGNRAANNFGEESAAITIDESVRGMMAVIDQATRETHGGRMWTYEGKEVPW